jgi:hypothetical protein
VDIISDFWNGRGLAVGRARAQTRPAGECDPPSHGGLRCNPTWIHLCTKVEPAPALFELFLLPRTRATRMAHDDYLLVLSLSCITCQRHRRAA